MTKNKKEKKVQVTLSPYMNQIHKVGTISSIIVIITFLAVGIGICAYFDIFPTAIQLIMGALVFFLLLGLIGAMEFVAYLPVLGSGATYISFITGNISNMKLPSITAAMNALDVENGTEEHEVLSIIASSVASLLVIVLITVVIIFTGALKPLLEWEPIQPAFENVLPAIYAILGLGALSNLPKVVIPTFFFGLVIAYFTDGIVGTMALMFGCVIFAVILARVLFKTGVQKPVDQ